MLFAGEKIASCYKTTFSNLQTLFSRTSEQAIFSNNHFTKVFSFSYMKGAMGFSASNMIKTGSRSFIMHKENSRTTSNIQQLKTFLIIWRQSLFSHKMKFGLPLPPCLHLFNFGNSLCCEHQTPSPQPPSTNVFLEGLGNPFYTFQES